MYGSAVAVRAVAAIHQGASGQMTSLEDPLPWLKPWLRPVYCFASVIVRTENKKVTISFLRKKVHPVTGDLAGEFSDFEMTWLLYCAGAATVSGHATLNLADDCCLVSDSIRRSLWSADVPICVVPRTLSSYCDRTFAAAEPRLWNSLPVQLRYAIQTSPTDCSDDS